MKTASRTATALLMAVTLLAVTVGCSKDLASSTSPTDVHRQVGAIGQAVDNFGLYVTVLRIEAADLSIGGFPRLLVSIRTENKRPAPGQNPDVVIQCEKSKPGGDWFDTSTWEPQGELPAGQVAEGQLLIAFPSKTGATRYPVATCSNAQVVVTTVDPSDQSRELVTSYPVDDAIVQTALTAGEGTT